MSVFASVLNKLTSVVHITRMINSFSASLTSLSTKPTLELLRVRGWASLREKSEYDQVLLATRTRDELFSFRSMQK